MKKYLGLFDSGVGGLTVLKEILKVAPNLDIIYFGDNQNAPYGQKSQEEIIDLTKEAFAFLKEKGADRIVTACNSVSAIVNRELAKSVGMEENNIIEMSEPTVKYCFENNLKKILILSTEATMKSGLYQNQFLERGIGVDSIAINGLVDLIEFGADDGKKEMTIKKELEKDKNILKKIKKGEYQNIILACTHFPLVEDIFKKVFLEEIKSLPNFINPAVFVAEEVLKRFGNNGEGRLVFHFSKELETVNYFLKEFDK